MILFISSLFGEYIYWQGDYNKALKEAKEIKKPLMVLLIENNCSRCKSVIRDVFTNQPYIEKFNKKFISIIVNRDYKYSYPIELYYSNSYPTLFFVDSQNETFLIEPIYDKNITKERINSLLF
jgi:thioredoxin-related protein